MNVLVFWSLLKWCTGTRPKPFSFFFWKSLPLVPHGVNKYIITAISLNIIAAAAVIRLIPRVRKPSPLFNKCWHHVCKQFSRGLVFIGKIVVQTQKSCSQWGLWIIFWSCGKLPEKQMEFCNVAHTLSYSVRVETLWRRARTLKMSQRQKNSKAEGVSCGDLIDLDLVKEPWTIYSLFAPLQLRVVRA